MGTQGPAAFRIPPLPGVTPAGGRARPEGVVGLGTALTKEAKVKGILPRQDTRWEPASPRSGDPLLVER